MPTDPPSEGGLRNLHLSQPPVKQMPTSNPIENPDYSAI